MKKSLLFAACIYLLLQSGYSVRAQFITLAIPGAINTYITCVNDSNIIAGYFDDTAGVHGFIYNGATVSIFNYPGAEQTYVYGINNAKTVVGAYNINGSTVNNEGFKRDSNGVFTDLTSSWLASQTITIARDINDADCIIGDYKQNTTHVGFSMCNGVNSTFHYNYKPTYVNSLNNYGQRTGFWIEGSQRHGLIYKNGSWSQLEYPGSTRTMITGLNDSNVVVGVYNLNRSFIYRNGVFKSVHKSGSTDFQVRDINNKGLLVGYYKDASNVYKGFWMKIWDIGFRPNPDGWQFENGKDNIWPISWYGQFDYSRDPYLGGDNPFPHINYADGSKDTVGRYFFPDWPLFVEVLGEDQCYNTGGGYKVIRSKAVLKFFSIVRIWGGSCFGFVQSSYMAWDSVQRFKAKFPDVGPWTSSNKLYDLPLNDGNRRCINHLMTKQSQLPYYRYKASRDTLTPTETLEEIKKLILDPSKNESGLSISNQNGPGGHIVNPYKVEIDSTNPFLEYIYVYDNNWPNDTTRKISIYTLLDCWMYNLATSAGAGGEEWGGFFANKGIRPSWPVRNFYNDVDLDSVAKVEYQNSNLSNLVMEFYNSADCDIRITDPGGRSIGFQGNLPFSDIPGGIPMTRDNSRQESPYGYYVPVSDYSIELSDFRAGLSYLNVFDDNYTYQFSRSSATLNEKDLLGYNSNGLTLYNPDGVSKTINMSSILEEDNAEMSVEVEGMPLSSQGNIKIQSIGNKRVKLTNNALTGHYNLKLHLGSGSAVGSFFHDSIPIEANTSHIISPLWESLYTSEVTVYVDNGNNGTYDDTLYFGNHEPGQIICYPSQLKLNAGSQSDTLFITNNGGGIMNWTVSTDEPAWILIDGDYSGQNSGSVQVGFSDNPGSSRNGNIFITAPGATNSPFKIPVNQLGILTPSVNISASDGTYSDGIHITWSAVAGATHYRLYRSDGAGSTGTPVSTWTSATTFIDTSTIKGKFYYYCVIAAQDTNGLNESGFSKKDAGWRNGFTANFDMEGGCTGQVVNFTDRSTNRKKAYYLWDIDNDGITDYTGSQVWHIYQSSGVYTVKLTVTDSIQFLDSLVKELVIQDFPSVTLIRDTVLCADQTIVLDAGTGFDSYNWSTGETTPSITLDSAGYGYGIHSFYVAVGTANGCSALSNTRIRWDSCGIAGGYTLQGQLSYDNNTSTPLSFCIVSLLQGEDTVNQTATNSNGEYTFANIPAGTYVLTASCLKPWGGVNAIDALQVIRHFVGLSSLAGIRLIAADVNANNTINSIDALMIARRFVGIDTAFAAGDWAIEKDTLTIGDNPTLTANLKAVTFGDVDASYLPPLKSTIGLSVEAEENIISDLDKVIAVPVKMIAPEAIGALSLIIHIPATSFELKEITTTYEGTFLYHYHDGQLRIAWYSLNPMIPGGGDAIFTIYGRILSTELQTTAWTLDPFSQVANTRGEVLSGVTLTLPKFSVDRKFFLLSQNSPNPFKDETGINWLIPESAHILLRVFDQAGNEIKTLVDARFNAGFYSTGFSAKGLNPGVYTYSIEVRGKDLYWTDSKQMVILR